MDGKDVFIYLNNQPIASFTTAVRPISDDTNTSAELIEASSPSDGQWKHYIRGRKSWSINTSFLVTNAVNGIDVLLMTGTTYTIKIYSRYNGSIYARMTGTAFLQQCQITARKGNLVQGSFVFVGDGPLTSA